ncbi:MAG: UPF0236 family protein [Firmicutes bacterium]|nr:UPF0236 family protein [Bacillota bacterium]
MRDGRGGMESARQWLTAAFEHLDDTLCAEAAERIHVVCKAERHLTARMGPLTVRRRDVQDRTTGRRYYPVDAALGLAPRERLSPGVPALGVQAVPATAGPPQGRRLRAWIPSLSAMACWHVVQRVGARVQVQQASGRCGLWTTVFSPRGLLSLTVARSP